MRECRTYGSVRGVGGNAHPYRDSSTAFEHGMMAAWAKWVRLQRPIILGMVIVRFRP